MDKKHFPELVQAMLTRPRMYAQNPGSLEDQFCLLLTCYAPKLLNEYRYEHRAVIAPGKSIEEVAEILQSFWDNHKDGT